MFTAILYVQVETLQEKIISLELTKPTELDLDEPINGNGQKNDDGDETVSEPATPTTSEEKTLEDATGANKKRRRKRSKKGKHWQLQILFYFLFIITTSRMFFLGGWVFSFLMGFD